MTTGPASKVEPSFKRYEFKFLADEYLLEAFISSFGEALQRDANFYEPIGYRVDSIYFDCIQLKDFFDKEEAILKRGKFRLRGYDNLFRSARQLLEYKAKFGDFVHKERIPISHSEFEYILDSSLFDFGLKIASNCLPAQIREILSRPTLLPRTIVSYYRKAYFFAGDSRVRVTVDTNIRSGLFARPYRRGDLYSFRGGLSVLEIKFEKHLPLLLSQRIKEFELERQSNSKAALSFSENRINRFAP